MQKSHVAYSLPGSDYRLVTGSSQNITQQNHHVQNITSQSSGYQSVAKPSVSLHSGTRDLELRISHEPFSYIVDTDSHQFVIDSGSNRIIVNNASLLNNLHVTADQINGIGGSPVQVTGGEKLNLTLKSDGDQVSHINNLDAVLVPSSPYNLIPPQLLVTQIKNRGFLIEKFYRD